MYQGEDSGLSWSQLEWRVRVWARAWRALRTQVHMFIILAFGKLAQIPTEVLPCFTSPTSRKEQTYPCTGLGVRMQACSLVELIQGH